jgi:hypothetical protein
LNVVPIGAPPSTDTVMPSDSEAVFQVQTNTSDGATVLQSIGPAADDAGRRLLPATVRELRATHQSWTRAGEGSVN